MPKRSVRQRRKHGAGCLTVLIGMLAVIAVILGVAIVVTTNIDIGAPAGENIEAAPTVGGEYLDPEDPNSQKEHTLELDAGTFSTPLPGAVVNTPTPSPTPAVTPVPLADMTPQPTFDPENPYALVRPTPRAENLLPVFKKANTDKKQIAITLDECSGATITDKFIKLAANYGAKLTLFPTGENIMKEGMANVLKEAVFTYGFEVENRCYSDLARLYQLNDAMMATEIWKQNIALSYVLGVKYEPHFLRVYGGNGDNDPRTHAYLKQEGYYGFAGWSVSGTDISEANILNTLDPGQVYYFKTSEADGRKMMLLMEGARRAGYEMVTLNELFGYEENKQTDVQGSLLTETLPMPTSYTPEFYTMRSGDCTWAVYQVQHRLVDLNYLPFGEDDGIYGEATTDALCEFQAACGMAATGLCTIETQQRLFADDAPIKEIDITQSNLYGDSTE